MRRARKDGRDGQCPWPLELSLSRVSNAVYVTSTLKSGPGSVKFLTGIPELLDGAGELWARTLWIVQLTINKILNLISHCPVVPLQNSVRPQWVWAARFSVPACGLLRWGPVGRVLLHTLRAGMVAWAGTGPEASQTSKAIPLFVYNY